MKISALKAKQEFFAWIARFFSDDFSVWKAYSEYLLKPLGGDFSVFVQSSTRSCFGGGPNSVLNLLKFQLIIYYHNYMKANTIFLSDLTFDLDAITSFKYYLAKLNGLRDSNFLTWTGVRCALSSHLKGYTVNRNCIKTLQRKIGDKIFNSVFGKSEDFCALLISNKETHSRGFSKLKSKFSIDDEVARKAFSLITSVISETFLQSFSSKYLMTLHLPILV